MKLLKLPLLAKLLFTVLLLSLSSMAQAQTSTSCSATGLPAGWVVTSVTSDINVCAQGSFANTYHITNTAGLSSVNACYLTTPTGWVITSEFTQYNTCAPNQNAFTFHMVNTAGLSTVDACYNNNLPTGWVVTYVINQYSTCYPDTNASTFHLVYTAGLPSIQACYNTPPSGWVVSSTTSAYNTCMPNDTAPLYNMVNNNPGQTITFAAISDQVLGTSPFTVSATASSGLAVTLASLTSSVCTVSGNTVTLHNLGPCNLSASQAGSLSYLAATTVTRSFAVLGVTSFINQSTNPTYSGSSYTISWGSTYATSCVVDYSLNGATPTTYSTATSGSLTTAPTAVGSYVWRNICQGPGGPYTSSFTHTVQAAPVTADFNQSLTSAPAGTSWVVSWSSNNADSCAVTAQRPIDSSPLPINSGINGSQTVTPTIVGTHYWYLSCTGAAGTVYRNFTHEVTAPVPTAQITQSVNTTVSGSSYVVSWTSNNADSCAVTAQRPTDSSPIQYFTGTNGSQTVSPTIVGTHYWWVTCTGAGGTASDTFTHTVLPPVPTAQIAQSVNTTVSGSPYVVSWTSNNADSCTVTAQRPTDSSPIQYFTGTSGSQTVSPAIVGTHYWWVNCTGAGGTASDTFTHTVTAS